MYRTSVLCLLALSASACAAPTPDLVPCESIGEAWHKISPPGVGGSARVNAFAMNRETMFASVQASGLRSTDDGGTWSDLPYAYDNYTFSADGTVVYAGLGNGSAVSHDSGETWDPGPGMFVSAIDAANPSVVYGIVGSSGPNGEQIITPYRSENGGAPLTPMNVGIDGTEFISDPVTPDRVYVTGTDDAGARLYRRSDDRGATWETVATATQVLRVGDGGGTNAAVFRFDGRSVDRSEDGGHTWTPLSSVQEGVEELIVTDDGTPVVFTEMGSVLRGSSSRGWSKVGTTPEHVQRAYIGGCSKAAVIVPHDAVFSSPDHVFLTHSLGAEP
jgi:hypothetical protein